MQGILLLAKIDSCNAFWDLLDGISPKILVLVLHRTNQKKKKDGGKQRLDIVWYAWGAECGLSTGTAQFNGSSLMMLLNFDLSSKSDLPNWMIAINDF